MSTQSISALLVAIQSYLERERPDYVEKMMPGASTEALAAFESRFGVTMPAAFHALYRWHDGQDPWCFTGLVDNWSLMRLDDIIDGKEILDGMIGLDFEDPAWWRRGWIPFLHNGGGSHLCIDLRVEDGGTPGQLIEFWKADADRPVTYPNLEQWLIELHASMEDGTYSVC